MAQTTPSLQFEEFHGKMSSYDRTILRTRNGRVQSYSIHNPYKGPLAESRKRAINTFSQAVQQCKAEMMDETKIEQWKTRFLRYRKAAAKNAAHANAEFITPSDLQNPNTKVYSTLRGFIIASLAAQLTQNA